MNAESSRSEQVVEEYKKHKLAMSALRKVHTLIRGFEDDYESNLRMAGIGLLVILAIVACAVYFFMDGVSVTIS
jgi:hypothetical protein